MLGFDENDNALLIACEEGDADLALFLLCRDIQTLKPMLDAVNSQGQGPLILATRRGLLGVVSDILRLAPELVYQKDSDGKSAASYAIENKADAQSQTEKATEALRGANSLMCRDKSTEKCVEWYRWSHSTEQPASTRMERQTEIFAAMSAEMSDNMSTAVSLMKNYSDMFQQYIKKVEACDSALKQTMPIMSTLSQKMKYIDSKFRVVDLSLSALTQAWLIISIWVNKLKSDRAKNNLESEEMGIAMLRVIDLAQKHYEAAGHHAECLKKYMVFSKIEMALQDRQVLLLGFWQKIRLFLKKAQESIVSFCTSAYETISSWFDVHSEPRNEDLLNSERANTNPENQDGSALNGLSAFMAFWPIGQRISRETENDEQADPIMSALRF